MKERPILFQGAMVRALLAGTKTQTRRAVKPHGRDAGFVLYEEPGGGCWPYRSDDGERGFYVDTKGDDTQEKIACPYGQPGDRLWVRETWMPDAPRNGEWADTAFYGCGMSPLSDIPECYRKPWHCLHRATYEGCELVGWKPSIHMPRWACRITLEITGVRAERLQAIGDRDAQAEGVVRHADGHGWHVEDGRHYMASPVDSYASLWEAINGSGSWDANPWVWVVEFRRSTP